MKVFLIFQEKRVLYEGSLNEFQQLLNAIDQQFGLSSQKHGKSIYYKDSDGDNITINCNEDLSALEEDSSQMKEIEILVECEGYQQDQHKQELPQQQDNKIIQESEDKQSNQQNEQPKNQNQNLDKIIQQQEIKSELNNFVGNSKQYQAVVSEQEKKQQQELNPQISDIENKQIFIQPEKFVDYFQENENEKTEKRILQMIDEQLKTLIPKLKAEILNSIQNQLGNQNQIFDKNQSQANVDVLEDQQTQITCLSSVQKQILQQYIEKKAYEISQLQSILSNYSTKFEEIYQNAKQPQDLQENFISQQNKMNQELSDIFNNLIEQKFSNNNNINNKELDKQAQQIQEEEKKEDAENQNQNQQQIGKFQLEITEQIIEQALLEEKKEQEQQQQNNEISQNKKDEDYQNQQDNKEPTMNQLYQHQGESEVQKQQDKDSKNNQQEEDSFQKYVLDMLDDSFQDSNNKPQEKPIEKESLSELDKSILDSKNQYDQFVLNKAQKINEILPGDINKYLAFVQQNQNLSVNDLLEKFIEEKIE